MTRLADKDILAPCPNCGGRDAIATTFGTDEKPLWYCFSCDSGGNLVDHDGDGASLPAEPETVDA